MDRRAGQSAKAFEATLRRGLRAGTYDPPVRDIVRAVKGVQTATELMACMDAYCKLFDPATPPTKRESLELARTSGYNLFARAVELADARNGMARFVAEIPEVAISLPDAVLPLSGLRTAKRFTALDKKDRDLLQARARQRVKEIEAAKRVSLVDQLLEQQRRSTGRPSLTLDEILVLLANAPDKRHDLEVAAIPCEAAWTASADRSTPSRAREALDNAFDGFQAYLDDELKQPADLVRILRWLGAAAANPRTPWPNVWPELYLDALARGQQLAVTAWNIGSAIQARGFTGADAALLFAPLSGKTRRLLLMRLKQSFANVAGFAKGHRARRQAFIIGKMLRLSLLDEAEAEDLVERMKEAWKRDPIEVVNRSFQTQGQKDAFRGKFHINRTARDAFTVLWIDGVMVTVEVHRLPGYWFQAHAHYRALPDLLEDSAYRALARNAVNLTAFMLAYLQLLGYALDVATAGATGGLRHIVLRFAEERLKDYLVGKGLELAKIDNPWVHTVAGLAGGLVPSVVPKPRKLNIPLDTAPAHPAPMPPPVTRPPSGVPSAVERGALGLPLDARLGATSPTPRLEIVPDNPPARFQPAPTAAPLTAAEETAQAAQSTMLAGRRAQVYELPIARVANDEVAVSSQQVVASAGGGGSGGGRVTPAAGTSYGTGTYVAAPGVLRRPVAERPQRPPPGAPEEWERALEEAASSRNPMQELYDERIRNHFGAAEQEFANTGNANIRARNPGGQRIRIETEAGLLVHWLTSKRIGDRAGYAEALRKIVGHPRIPPGFEEAVASGRIVTLSQLPGDLQREVLLGSKFRADRVGGAVIYELKPNTMNAIRRGLVQVDEYVRLFQATVKDAPKHMRGIIVLYDADVARSMIAPH